MGMETGHEEWCWQRGEMGQRGGAKGRERITEDAR